MASLDDIKKLRGATGAGVMSAKKALEEAGGDFDKAIKVLRLAGEASAAKRADRDAGAGLVDSYVHLGRIGVVVEVNCETDFVARTDDFKAFTHDIAMQVAASAPEHLISTDVLMSQPFFKDPDMSVADITKALIAKLGENIVIRRWSRVELGVYDD